MRNALIAVVLSACGGAPAPPAPAAPAATPAPAASPPPNAPPPPPPETATPASGHDLGHAAEAFLDEVTSSRLAIQRCYEQALRTDANLANRPAELLVLASFDDGGANTEASTSPTLGAAFDACFAQVAAKWTVSPKLGATKFKAKLTLTPQ